MPPYNPNSVWTSKDNPNLPRAARSVTPRTPSGGPEGAGPDPKDGKDGVKDEKKDKKEEHPHESLVIGPPRKRSFKDQYGLWLFGVGLLVLIGAIITAVILLRPPAQPTTTLSLEPPSGVSVGSPFTISISANNTSAQTLTGAVIALQVPSGVEFVGSDSSTQVREFPLGDLAPGAVAAETSTLIVTGNPDTLLALSAKLLYSTKQTPSTTYETDKSVSFSAGSAALSITYSAPTNIVSGQPFPFTVNYQNTGSQPITDGSIELKYPPAFTFSSANPTPAVVELAGSGGLWNVGTLAPGQGGSFTVNGTVVGPDNAQYQIMGTAYTSLSGQRYTINSQPVNFTLVPSPLELTVSANGSTNYVASPADSLTYTITYTNNSAVTLSGAKITAQLVGQMYNFAKLRTNGAFNSNTNTITWYAANTPALASIAPGGSGSVTFTLTTQSSFPIRVASDKNYTLGVTATIASPTVIPGAAGSSTVSTVQASNRVAGAITLASQGYFKSGPYPPKVGQPTTYTIDWTVTNYAADAQDVTVSGYLQSGTTFLGAATSTNTTSTPVYDPTTGLITWTIPFIAADTGVIGAPLRAQFTVTNTPAVNQVGNDVTLLGKTSLTGTDDWGGEAYSVSADPVTTRLPDDTSLGKGSREVVQ